MLGGGRLGVWSTALPWRVEGRWMIPTLLEPVYSVYLQMMNIHVQGLWGSLGSDWSFADNRNENSLFIVSKMAQISSSAPPQSSSSSLGGLSVWVMEEGTWAGT